MYYYNFCKFLGLSPLTDFGYDTLMLNADNLNVWIKLIFANPITAVCMCVYTFCSNINKIIQLMNMHDVYIATTCLSKSKLDSRL